MIHTERGCMRVRIDLVGTGRLAYRNSDIAAVETCASLYRLVDYGAWSSNRPVVSWEWADYIRAGKNFR